MTTFLRVDDPDDECVTIVFWSQEGITRCRMLGPTKMIFGQPFELHGPVAGAIAAARALEVGRRFADAVGVPMVIVDPEHLWNDAWGTLADRRGTGLVPEAGTARSARV
ncbi:hypothetical protein PQJ75_00500 [Rhodoplanes sp. TEM]|uniref:Uncharacterized protein n=1 Tax=Rhodoplanes tepidamans TaxID=200616 RepID=A0ABT5J5R2_RHOTP|nr:MULTISPECIES: hypothetical protein [Rhodoplanes]MDC7784731.1 hypothetical protein [Rhodoplanes tepidamans]MDC7982198.1 hypothetical protein [Rhodoplanes sp. TEM]MDQ0356203.1 hypothetical protein [Rhodoplanes tepidamans]